MSHPSSHNHKMSIMCESYLYLYLPLTPHYGHGPVSQSVSQAHVAFERHQTYLSAFPQELSLSATPELKPKPNSEPKTGSWELRNNGNRVQLQLELLKIPNQNLECPLAYTYPGGMCSSFSFSFSFWPRLWPFLLCTMEATTQDKRYD